MKGYIGKNHSNSKPMPYNLTKIAKKKEYTPCAREEDDEICAAV
jgi:hypothetical protein